MLSLKESIGKIVNVVKTEDERYMCLSNGGARIDAELSFRGNMKWRAESEDGVAWLTTLGTGGGVDAEMAVLIDAPIVCQVGPLILELE